MNIIQAVALGVVEGITEFLPISSTFHLIFTAKILGIVQTDFTKLFEVFIQGGAILSAALLFFTDVVKYKDQTKRVIISFIPTALVGLILYKFIKNVLFENQILMVGIFALMGIVFIVVERLVKKKRINLIKDIKSLSYKEALIVGLFQSLAVIPGVSRAGIVIVAMMALGYKRDKSAYYSFLLAIPTVLAASFYDLFKMRSLISHYSGDLLLLIVGFSAAFFSSLLVLKWFINYLKNNSLSVFGFYRLLLAIILTLSLLLKV